MSAGGRLILVDFDDGIDAFECRLPLLRAQCASTAMSSADNGACENFAIGRPMVNMTENR
jgi:hypothetical protein